MVAVAERPKIVQKKRLNVGALVISYSKHTGFSAEELGQQFDYIGKIELSQMKPGHTFFVDVGTLYPGGEVRGWAKVAIESIDIVGGMSQTELRIHYRGGVIAGFRSTKRGICKDFVRAVNEHELVELVESMPLSKTIYQPRS